MLLRLIFPKSDGSLAPRHFLIKNNKKKKQDKPAQNKVVSKLDGLQHFSWQSRGGYRNNLALLLSPPLAAFFFFSFFLSLFTLE